MPCRDDINKLPMPASGKRYARRHGKDILHNFSQYAKMVTDTTGSAENDQRDRDVGVTLPVPGKKKVENMKAKQILNNLFEHIKLNEEWPTGVIRNWTPVSNSTQWSIINKYGKDWDITENSDILEASFVDEEGVETTYYKIDGVRYRESENGEFLIKESMKKAKQILNRLFEDEQPKFDLAEFTERYPRISFALVTAWKAKHAGSLWDKLKVENLDFPVDALDKAEEYATGLNDVELEAVATDLEHADSIGLTERPGWPEFDKVMHDLFSSLAEPVIAAESLISEHVYKRGDKWVVTNKAGNKVLGTHPDKASAVKQLQAIEIHKHESLTLNEGDFEPGYDVDPASLTRAEREDAKRKEVNTKSGKTWKFTVSGPAGTFKGETTADKAEKARSNALAQYAQKFGRNVALTKHMASLGHVKVHVGHAKE